ncbi:MAG: CDP-archaeol synthase, partial [Candidatus Hodarchaeales archaeon]
RNIERGSSFLGLDQLGFIVMSLLLIALTFPLTMTPRYTWFDFAVYTVILIPVTFIIHIVFNWGSYKAGLQDVKL